MPFSRGPLSHALAVATGVLTYLGALVLEARASGDIARAFGREAIDTWPYWYFALPACYLAAGGLGYLGGVRPWRWSLDMQATHAPARWCWPAAASASGRSP